MKLRPRVSLSAKVRKPVKDAIKRIAPREGLTASQWIESRLIEALERLGIKL
jgi:hypothetical protein